MNTAELQERLGAAGVVPVVALDHIQHALPLADALLNGGIPVIEVTFRTAAAAEVIRLLTRERPNLLVGAGTVLTAENARAAKDAGAKFAVAPGLNPAMVKLTGELGLPFIPGVATPTEVEMALSLGCRLLKYFPAGLMGGAKMLSAICAPYGHTGVRFIPTGGVSPANLASYFALSAVVAVGGTWLARKDDLTAEKWNEIRRRCAAAVDTVARVRAQRPPR
jgi:2-dehydro-3-deoxyphosphogluconate aldolase / (4S)-4-hydroxy-2-oxoglutarate aldolase